jgi:hypothetical protein
LGGQWINGDYAWWNWFEELATGIYQDGYSAGLGATGYPKIEIDINQRKFTASIAASQSISTYYYGMEIGSFDSSTCNLPVYLKYSGSPISSSNHGSLAHTLNIDLSNIVGFPRVTYNSTYKRFDASIENTSGISQLYVKEIIPGSWSNDNTLTIAIHYSGSPMSANGNQGTKAFEFTISGSNMYDKGYLAGYVKGWNDYYDSEWYDPTENPPSGYSSKGFYIPVKRNSDGSFVSNNTYQTWPAANTAYNNVKNQVPSGTRYSAHCTNGTSSGGGLYTYTFTVTAPSGTFAAQSNYYIYNAAL